MLRCRRGHYSFPWITPLTLDRYLICKEASSTIFWIFGMTWPRTGCQSPRPLANTKYFWTWIQAWKECMEASLLLFTPLILSRSPSANTASYLFHSYRQKINDNVKLLSGLCLLSLNLVLSFSPRLNAYKAIEPSLLNYFTPDEWEHHYSVFIHKSLTADT